MIRDIDTFFEQAKPLVAAFEDFMEGLGMRERVKIDHLCFKCSAAEEFEYLRSLFDFESDFSYQSIIAERRIVYIRFRRKIETTYGFLEYLELSDQKKDKSQKSGFEHIEIYPVSESYEEMVKEFKLQDVRMEKIIRPHHTTYDIVLKSGFLLRLEKNPLIEKIIADEICHS